MGHSVSSIVKSARGDLNTDILEKIEFVYGLDFLESNEQIQYIGKSTWGVRIISDAVDDRLGSANYNLATDRGVRLVVKNEDEFVDDIVIGYDRINKIEYNSGITKDSIIIYTNENYTLNISKSNICFQKESSDKQTKEPIIESPSIKFRLRASVESGTSVEDIVSYIRDRIKEAKEAKEALKSQYSKLNKMSRRLDSIQIEIPKPNSFDSVEGCERKYDRLKSKIEDWRALESQYSKLNRKSGELDSKRIETPKPDSFVSIHNCNNKYDELEEEIVKWDAVEKIIAETHGIQSKIEEQVAGSLAEKMWLKSLPEVESVQEFDTATEAVNRYGSVKRNLENIYSVITQAVELEDYISRHASRMTRTEYTAIQQIHRECIDCLNNNPDSFEIKSNLRRLNDILSLLSSLTDEVNNLPIDPQELIDSIRDDGIPESEELQEWQNLTQRLKTEIDDWRAVESQCSELNRKSQKLDSRQIEIPKPDSFNSVGRCEREYDRLKSKIEDWKSAESRYSKLQKKSNRLDSKEVEVPEPDSFTSVSRCQKKYDELETKIKNWKRAENQYSNLREIQSEIKQQIADSPAERFWVEYLPEAKPPEEFDKPAKPTNEFGSIRAELENINPIVIQAVEVEGCISSHASKTMSTRTEHIIIQKIHQECIDRLGNNPDPSEIKSNLEQLNDILSLSSSLTDEVDNLPIDLQEELIESIRNNGIPESEELQGWQDLAQKVERISTFMSDVDLSHPSIDAEHWEESLEMAVEEQYVSVLSPIVDQVDKMESGMWELDDLQQISWQEFETLIGTLYKSFGYETEVTSDTADMGVDVWAVNSDERVAIQAKRYQEGNRVGRETLQKIASTLAKGDADRVTVVTTSEFARTAKEYSDSFGSEIKLINGEELRNQLNHSDLPPMKSY